MFLMHCDALFITLAVDMEKERGRGGVGEKGVRGPGLGNEKINIKRSSGRRNRNLSVWMKEKN